MLTQSTRVFRSTVAILVGSLHLDGLTWPEISPCLALKLLTKLSLTIPQTEITRRPQGLSLENPGSDLGLKYFAHHELALWEYQGMCSYGENVVEIVPMLGCA